jgi:hypothetical protein
LNVKELRPVATLIDPQGNDVTPLPWEEAQARIDAARWYWLTTLHSSGRPHTRPVLAVWTSGALCTTSAWAAQKGRNLRRDPRCSVAIMADDMHIVLEEGGELRAVCLAPAPRVPGEQKAPQAHDSLARPVSTTRDHRSSCVPRAAGPPAVIS